MPDVTETVDSPVLTLVIASASSPEPPRLTVFTPPSIVSVAFPEPPAPITLAKTALAAVGGVLVIVVPLRVIAELPLLARLSTDEPIDVVIVVPGCVVMDASNPAAGVQVWDRI
ncbi:hypothetical protein D3C85_1495850 [compost metagenome]